MTSDMATVIVPAVATGAMYLYILYLRRQLHKAQALRARQHAAAPPPANPR